GLGREIAIHGACGDARAPGNSGDLHGRHTVLARQRPSSRQNRVLPRGELLDDLFGATIRHRQEVNYDSALKASEPFSRSLVAVVALIRPGRAVFTSPGWPMRSC